MSSIDVALFLSCLCIACAVMLPIVVIVKGPLHKASSISFYIFMISCIPLFVFYAYQIIIRL